MKLLIGSLVCLAILAGCSDSNASTSKLELTPSSVNESEPTDLDPKISCILNKEGNQISCVSTNIQEGSQLKWTSTASDAYNMGSTWQFNINKQPVGNTEQVFLEICQGSSCQTVTTSIDTSELAPKGMENTTPKPTATPKVTPSAPPVLSLPFTIDHEPVGMMPMGETILHPNSPHGHPGIDFQWPYRAEVVAATNGEVLEIRTSGMTTQVQGSKMYYVAVMSGDFVVTYDIHDLYSFNPDLDVGSKVMSGQVMGYPNPAGDGEWTSIHWAFGKWSRGNGKPNPEGIVEKFRVDYMCPVPYFSETERLRLFRLWDAAKYPDAGRFKGEELRKQFPDVCNGHYKNY